jgi:hypothetical protein
MSKYSTELQLTHDTALKQLSVSSALNPRVLVDPASRDGLTGPALLADDQFTPTCGCGC